MNGMKGKTVEQMKHGAAVSQNQGRELQEGRMCVSC